MLELGCPADLLCLCVLSRQDKGSGEKKHVEGDGTGLKEGSRSKSRVSWMRGKTGPKRQGRVYLRRLLCPSPDPLLGMAEQRANPLSLSWNPNGPAQKWPWLGQTFCLLHPYPRVKKTTDPLRLGVL